MTTSSTTIMQSPSRMAAPGVLLAALLLSSSGGMAATDPNAVPVCYNFGCKSQETVQLTAQEWLEVSGWFQPAPTDAADERDRIKRAIGWMEVVVGKHTPTHRDTGLDLELGGEFPGQLDCIDESLNTTTYLRLFENQGLLRFHRVLDRAYRRAIFDQHWAGQVEEIDTGQRYVFDSWFQDNGILPYVQEAQQWEDIPFFYSSYVDNSPGYDEAEAEQDASLFQRLRQRLSSPFQNRGQPR